MMMTIARVCSVFWGLNFCNLSGTYYRHARPPPPPCTHDR